MSLIHILCPSCDGHGRYTIGAGPVAPLYVCEDCHGDGAARCDVGACREIAVDAVIVGRTAVPMCEQHFQMWQTEEAAHEQ